MPLLILNDSRGFLLLLWVACISSRHRPDNASIPCFVLLNDGAMPYPLLITTPVEWAPSRSPLPLDTARPIRPPPPPFQPLLTSGMQHHPKQSPAINSQQGFITTAFLCCLFLPLLSTGRLNNVFVGPGSRDG